MALARVTCRVALRSDHPGIWGSSLYHRVHAAVAEVISAAQGRSHERPYSTQSNLLRGSRAGAVSTVPRDSFRNPTGKRQTGKLWCSILRSGVHTAAPKQRRGNLGDVPTLKTCGLQFIVTRLAAAVSGERRCSVR